MEKKNVITSNVFIAAADVRRGCVCFEVSRWVGFEIKGVGLPLISGCGLRGSARYANEKPIPCVRFERI